MPATGPFPGTRDLAPLPDGTPVCAVMGDSHAALFAHAGWRPGQVKATLRHRLLDHGLADPRQLDPGGLCLTDRLAGRARPAAHAFEGNIRSTGAHADLAGEPARHDARRARGAGRGRRSDGVHLVPAFGGLAAPWWDDDAVGLISGLTFATRAPQLARAALESIAFQVEDTVAAIEALVGPSTRCSSTAARPPTAR